MLDLVRLPKVEHRHPTELSGGQQQRVALARALSFSPRMLLMDEALGALDAKLREYMQIEIRRIQQELRITTIHVTHDQDEALGMSDRVVVMRDGLIAQVAEPRDLYSKPSSVYVADFVGRINLLPARVVRREGDRLILELDEADLEPGSSRQVVAMSATDHDPGTRVRVGVRPESMTIREQPAAENCLAGPVRGVKFSGAIEYLTVAISPSTFVIATASVDVVPEGSVYAHWPADKTLVLAEER
jgi:ABC-type Fe3+/spermidine/putrescine transport system ATPase subunit